MNVICHDMYNKWWLYSFFLSFCSPWCSHEFNVYINVYIYICVPPLFGQCVGDRGSAGRWSVGAEDLPAHAGAEAGPFYAGPAKAARGADEDHGQCGHFLHAAHALYIHLQVGKEREREILQSALHCKIMC